MASGPILRLAESRPTDRYTLLGNHAALSVFAHSFIPFQEVLYSRMNHRGVQGRMAFVDQLRHLGIDKAYLLPNSFSSAFDVFLAGIPQRVGTASWLRSGLLTEARPPLVSPAHQSRRYADVLGLPPDSDILPSIQVTEAEKQCVRKKWFNPGKQVLAMAPGAAYGTAKRWPSERYAELAARCVQNWGVDILLLGSGREVPLCESIARSAGPGTTSIAGKTSLRDVFAILGESRLVVCNDSGIMHAATAVQTPVVAIFGPTDWKETYPPGSQSTLIREPVDCAPCMKRECPLKHHVCMTAITVERVLESAGEVLSGQDSM